MVRVKRNLDAADLEILKILSQNCKEKLENMSSKVGLSTPMVRKRMEMMEKLGIIKKCSAQIDLGMFEGIITKVLLIKHKGVEKIAEDLYRNKDVEKIYVSRTRDMIIALVRAITEHDIKNLVETIRREAPNTEIIDIDLVKERDWIPEKPGIRVIYRCNFCGGIILGPPYVIAIDDAIRTFHGKECAEAYIQKKSLRLPT